MEKMKNIVALIIDLQSPFLYQVEDRNSFVSSQKELISFCKGKGIPVALIEYFAYGETDVEIVEHLHGCFFKTFIKKQDDSFSSFDFQMWLEKMKIKNLIISGLFKSACVYKTAKTAVSRGYGIITSKEITEDSNFYDGIVLTEDYKRSMMNWYRNNGVLFDSLEELKNSDIIPARRFFYFCKKLKSSLV